MNGPLTLMTRLFQLVSERKFAEAGRILERITIKMKKKGQKEFNRSYLDALEGIILARRSGNERVPKYPSTRCKYESRQDYLSAASRPCRRFLTSLL